MKYRLIFVIFTLFLIISSHQSSVYNTPEKYIAPEKSIKPDKPDKSVEYEIEMTKDPKMGRPVPERLLEIRKDLKDGKYRKTNLRNTSNKWEERGPDNVGGRTRAILIDSNDPSGNKVWAGGVSGGLWVTNNFKSADANWTMVDDFLPTLSISTLAQDPTNPQVLYFGTGEGYFNGDAVRGLGIWKSEDGGSSWNQISNISFSYIQRIRINEQGDLYVCTRSGGVQRSINGGVSWVKVLGNGLGGAFSDRACDLEITSAGVIFASMGIQSSDGIYRSMDGGNTWEGLNGSNLNNGLPFENYERIEISFSHSNPQFGYALFQDPDENTCNGIFRTTDGGDNWESMTVPGAFDMDNFTRNQAWYDLNVAVDPFNEYIVYIGGIDILRSEDGGVTWTQLSQWYGGGGFQYVHADQHEMIFHDLNPLSGLVSNDGGVFSFEIDPLISGNGGPVYCNPAHFDCCSDYIAKLELNTIVNTSGAGNSTLINGYSDFTSMSTNLEQNEVYTVTVTPNFTWEDSKMGIWIDWNQDGEFSENENILSTSGQGPYTADFSVPMNAAHGPTRIRIRLQFSPDYVPHPCDGAYTMGETEDYTVVVNNCIEGNKCNDEDVCTEDDILDANCNCNGTPVDINQDGICDIINTPVFQSKNNGYNITQFYACDIDQTSGSNMMIAGSQDNGTQFFSVSGINSTNTVSGGDGGYCFIDDDEPNIQVSTYIYNDYHITNDFWGSIQESFSIGDEKGRFINPMDYDSESNTIIASYSENFIARVRNVGTENRQDTIEIPELAGLKVSAVKNVEGMENKMWVATSKAFSEPEQSNVVKLILLANTNQDEIEIENVFTFGDDYFQGGAFLRNIDIKSSDPNSMLICFSNYGVPSIWETNDGGSSWTNVEGNLPDMPVRWIIYDPIKGNGAIIATEMGVWKTDQLHGSQTEWYAMNEELANVKTNMLKYRRSDNTLVVATYGRGLFTLDYCTDEVNLVDVICEGESYELGEMSFSESGIYNISIEDENSCFEIINYTLELSVDTIETEELNLIICEGDTYDFFGEEISVTGNYEKEVEANNTCGVTSFELSLFVDENPILELGDTIYLNLGESTILNPGGEFAFYIWSTGSEEQELEVIADDLGVGIFEITLEVQNISGCSTIGTIIIVIQDPTGTQEIQNQEVLLYPNPAKDLINISFEETVKRGYFEVFDLSGKLLISQEIQNRAYEKIKVSKLVPGQYLVVFRSEDRIDIKKFIKF